MLGLPHCLSYLCLSALSCCSLHCKMFDTPRGVTFHSLVAAQLAWSMLESLKVSGFSPSNRLSCVFFNLYRWNKKYDADTLHFTNQICVCFPYSTFLRCLTAVPICGFGITLFSQRSILLPNQCPNTFHSGKFNTLFYPILFSFWNQTALLRSPGFPGLPCL